MNPPEALRIFECLATTIKDLDLSRGDFTTKDVDEILKVLPHLERLNISENRLERLDFTVRFSDVPLKMLDISRNPVKVVKMNALYNLNDVWKRGNVYMDDFETIGFAVESRDLNHSREFPTKLMGDYFRNNDIRNVVFFGTGKETFPVCQLTEKVVFLNLDSVYNLSTECIGKFYGLQFRSATTN